MSENPEGFSFEIVEICDETELNEKENYWIKYYNSIEEGYNIMSQHLIYQFSLDGKMLNCYNGYSEAARAVGKPDGKGNIYHCCKGTIKTAYGYRWSYYDNLDTTEQPQMAKPKNSGHSTKRKGVIQLSLDGQVLNTYPSCAEAARAVGVTGPAITHVCNGRAKTCKGFVWKYNEENWEV